MAINNPFYIVDRDLNKIAQIDNYTALSYCIKSYDFNEFQMKIPQDSIDGQKIIGLLDQEFYMVNINNPEETAYITVKGKKLGSKEREITLTGYGPKYRFFKKRTILEGIENGGIIISRTFNNIAADKIALDLISENCINASDADRNFPNLQIPVLSEVQKLLSRNYINEELFEELKKLMIDGEFIIRVIPDIANKKWNISIGLGVDRTGTGISKVVFSEGSKNLNSNELTVDDSQFQNVVVAFSESDGVGKITEVGDLVASGFDRYETPLFSNELEDAKIVDDANARLAETQSVLTVNAQAVSIGSNYIFKRDYDLYDKIIYKDNDTDIRSEERIINITRVYEKNKEPETVLEFGFTKTNTKEQNRDVTNRLTKLERKLGVDGMNFEKLKFLNFEDDGKITGVMADFIVLAGDFIAIKITNNTAFPLYVTAYQRISVDTLPDVEGTSEVEIDVHYNAVDGVFVLVPTPEEPFMRTDKDGIVTQILDAELESEIITNWDTLTPAQMGLKVAICGGHTNYDNTNQGLNLNNIASKIIWAIPDVIAPGEFIVLDIENVILSGLGTNVETNLIVEGYFRKVG